MTIRETLDWKSVYILFIYCKKTYAFNNIHSAVKECILTLLAVAIGHSAVFIILDSQKDRHMHVFYKSNLH